MRFIRRPRRRIARQPRRFIFSAAAAGPITGTLAATLDAATLSAAGVLPIVGTSAPTLGALTLSSVGALAGTGTLAATLADVTLSAAGAGATPITGSLAATLGALTLAGTGVLPIVGTSAPTLAALTLSAAGKLAIAGTLAKTLGTLTLSAAGYALSGACVAGVLTVDPTNGRYFRNSAGIVVLAGFHTWYDVQDGGASDPPAAFDWDEYLDALVAKGCNWTKLWFMETARDWPDFSGQYYTPAPWARTGPGNAADGKLKFDLTVWDETYFTRLRTRAIQAGNAGVYVTVQLFQGWQVRQKGMSTGTPWLYHPMENGNNINSIDGDTNNDGDGEETRSTSFTAVYNLQKAYVEKVIDTLNDLDHISWEVSNEETHSSAALAWERALAAYIKSYEAGKAKQHPVGITKLWPGGSNSDLFASDVEWTSIDDDYPTPDPDEADGSMVIIWDTDHVVGLTDEHEWVWQSFTRGNNPVYMDEWDGALFGTDKRATTANEKIRANLGYVLDYAARIDLANAVPHSSLASTDYCLAKTTGLSQFLVYQDASGDFTVTLTGISGTFSLEWLRVSNGTVQAGSNVAGNGVRTLTPPWSSEDVVAFLELIGVDGTLAATLGALTLSGAGKLAIVGTAAPTLAAVTLSAAGGAPAMAGSLAATLGAATLAAAGTLSIAGSLAATLDAATLSAAGLSFGVGTGVLVATLDAMTVSAAGTLAIAATAAVTLDAATLAAAGTLAGTGSLTATLEGVALAGIGKLAGTGSLTATLGDATLSAIGVEIVIIAIVSGTVHGPRAAGSTIGPRASGTVRG